MENIVRFNQEQPKFHYQKRSSGSEEINSIDKDEQVKIHYEDVSSMDVKNYDAKNFLAFESECSQHIDIKNYIAYHGGHSQGERAGYGCELTPAYHPFNTGDFYCGQWLKGLRHGSGICFYADGTVYKGAWTEGKWGVTCGMLMTLTGEILVGQFTGVHGRLKDLQWAQIKYSSGDVYTGMILHGKKQGRGFYYYINGDIYDGEWEDNQRQGKGTLTCKKGDSCKGEFIKDDFVTGIYTDTKGSKYRNADHEKPSMNGIFTKGRLYGQGRIDFADGGVYEGLFKDGKRSGQGRMNYVMTSENDPRGRETAEYTGEWRYNLRHGQGEMIWKSDGSRFEGKWHMDRRVNGTLKLGNNAGNCGASAYIGDFRDDLFHGFGKLILNDSNTGTVFEGVFEEGHCSKFGRLIYKDGSIYLGEQKDFKRLGNGVQLNTNGERYEG